MRYAANGCEKGSGWHDYDRGRCIICKEYAPGVIEIKSKKHLTHEEHLQLSNELRLIDISLDNICYRVLAPQFGKTHRTTKTCLRVLKAMASLKSALDSEYHRRTTDAQFMEKGHVYYQNWGLIHDPRG